MLTEPSIGAIVRVDPLTGDRATVSGFDLDMQITLGHGPDLFVPTGIARDVDGRWFVTDRFLRSVVRINPFTGDRTIISNATTGSGPVLQDPWDIAVEADGQLLVVDAALPAVIRVDPSTGNRTIVSDATTGRGPQLAGSTGIAIEADGQVLVVERAPVNGIVRIDPHSGNRTLLSGNDPSTGRLVGTGPALFAPSGIAVEPDGHLVVLTLGADNRRIVMRVDPASGNRTLLSHVSPGAPTSLPVAHLGIAIEASGQVVIADDQVDAIVRVDALGNGDHVVISK
jgi:streptogramin lyase